MILWFWYRLQNFENRVTSVRPYWDKFWKNFLAILVNRKVMINHRGEILIFGQIFEFGENRKFEILNPSSNPNFDLNPKPKLILANFGYLLNLVLPNLDRSRRQLSNDTKIVKFGQNLVPKFLISQILWVLGDLQVLAVGHDLRRVHRCQQRNVSENPAIALFFPRNRGKLRGKEPYWGGRDHRLFAAIGLVWVRPVLRHFRGFF